MGRNNRVSKERFKKALEGSYGVQTIIAKKLGVGRSAITNFLNKNDDMRELCNQEREKIIDIAENRLHSAVNKGQKWAVKMLLSSIGKNRGYVEKQEIEINGTVALMTKEERAAEIKRLLGK